MTKHRKRPKHPRRPRPSKVRPRRPAPRATTYTGGGKNVKKETKLGLTVGKDEDFGQWYSELVVASELISYYDVSGC